MSSITLGAPCLRMYSTIVMLIVIFGNFHYTSLQCFMHNKLLPVKYVFCLSQNITDPFTVAWLGQYFSLYRVERNNVQASPIRTRLLLTRLVGLAPAAKI